MHGVFQVPVPAFQRPLAQSWHVPAASSPHLMRFVPLPHVLHAVHALWLASGWYCPVPHAAHSDMPVSAANVPGSQLAQVESQTPVASLNLPTAHLLHDPALASLHWVRNLPLPQATQASHDALPAVLWKRPVAQFVQVESQFAAVALNWPALHLEHVPAAEFAQPESAWPALHGLQSLHEILPSSF